MLRSDIIPSLPSRRFLFLCLASFTNLCGCYPWDQKCGWATINPQTTICCEGLIYVRDGVQPTCCGKIAYDAFSSYCCNGRVQAKNKYTACCGEGTYDMRFQVCHHGSDVMQRNFPGSTCCRRSGQWNCCRQGQGCCSRAQSVDIPGFRPACCDIASPSRKARCCSVITQKTGVMPSCCSADRVRPTCCRAGSSSSSSFQCCPPPGYGRPSCCQEKDNNVDRYHPYHPPSTHAPSHIVPVHPTPLPRPGSCCSSRSPRPECCRAVKPYPGHGTNVQTPERSVQPSKPRCCIYRYTCCAVRSNRRHGQCCKRPASSGARPRCCRQSSPPPTPAPQPSHHFQREHKCYSCKLNNGNYQQGPVPLVSADDDDSNEVDYGGKGYASTGGGQGWATLSCCQSNYHKQCCRNAHRLTGIYVACCDASIISGGDNNNSHQPQTANRGQRREAMCSGRPYNASYQVCCYGVLRERMGSQASCCGTQVFNSATHKCCSGTVKRTCYM